MELSETRDDKQIELPENGSEFFAPEKNQQLTGRNMARNSSTLTKKNDNSLF